MSVLTTTIRMEDSQFFASLNRMEGRLSGLSATMAGLAGRMALAFAPIAAGIGGVTAATLGLKKAVNEAANMEQLQTSFEVLIGSATVAQETLAGLQKFADETTFQMPELAGASKQLIAFGVGATEVVDSLRMLGDVAAGLNINLSELVDVYGRNLVQGRLFSRDIYQFQSRGIPIIAALAAQFGVAESEIMGMVEAGKVGSKEMVAAFQALTKEGGMFAGMLQRQSRTFNGLMSTLTDNITARFREFGQPITEELKPVLDELIQKVQSMGPAVREFGDQVARIMSGISAAFASGNTLGLIQVSLELAFAKAMNFLAGGLETALAVVGAGFVTLFGSEDFRNGLAKVLLGVAGQFGAALLEAVQAPMAYVQAKMESIFDHGSYDNVVAMEQARVSEAQRLRNSDPRFQGKSDDELGLIRSRLQLVDGSWTDTVVPSSDNQQFRKAVEKAAKAKVKLQTVKERFDAIMKGEGVSYAGMFVSQIAQASQDTAREGAEQMKNPLRQFRDEMAQILSDPRVVNLYGDRLKQMEERFREFFPKGETLVQADDSANARLGKGAAELMGGEQAKIVADSLAQIGGGGGVAGVSSVLDETRSQTIELREANQALKESNQTLKEIRQSVVSGRYNGSDFQISISR